MTAQTLAFDILARDKASAVIDRVGGKFKTLGGGIAALGAIRGVFNLGEQFANSFDRVIIGTGETGTALAGLEKDFRRVGQTTPSSLADVGTAIAGIRQRTGQAGPGLQALAKQMLNLSRLTKTDVSVNVAAMTRLFGDWSIATKDQAGTLDKLFKASQVTGIGVDRLSELMVQFGSPLRQLGLDFDFTAAMFARFEKEGVNIETAMPGLRMALKNFAKAGREPAPALLETMDAIKNASTVAKANTIAFEVFGVRAGPDLAAAIREGRFELGPLMEQLKKSGGALDDATKATRGFTESWQEVKNKVILALGPKFDDFFNMVSRGMDRFGPSVGDGINTAIAAVATFGDAVRAIGGFLDDHHTLVAGVAAAYGVHLATGALRAGRELASFLRVAAGVRALEMGDTISGVARSLRSVHPAALAATAVITVAGTMWLNAAKKKREFKAAVEGATDAIKRDNGAIAANTREYAVNALSKSGALKSARELGISMADLTDAALGDARAMARVDAALQGAEAAYEAASVAAARGDNSMLRSTLKNANAADDLRGKLGSLTRAIHEGKDAALLEAQAMGGAAAKANALARSIEGIPRRWRSTISADAAQAIVEARRARDAINGVKNRHVLITMERREVVSFQGRRDAYRARPRGAHGAIVTRPTEALIAEAGPEAVIPLSRTPGSRPLPPSMPGGAPDPAAYARALVRELRANGLTLVAVDSGRRADLLARSG